MAEQSKQLGLQRLEKERLALTTPVQAPTTKFVDTEVTGVPVIDTRAGIAVPIIFTLSQNPFSAGRYPLGRNYSVGDEGVFRVSDLLTDIQTEIRSLVVTRVLPDEDRVEFNSGTWAADLMGNWVLKDDGAGTFHSPQQLVPNELYVGRKWKTAYATTNQRGQKFTTVLNMKVVAFERMRVAAGEFDTFRIEGIGVQSRAARQTNLLWILPGLNFEIKSEIKVVTPMGAYLRNDRLELVSVRQLKTES